MIWLGWRWHLLTLYVRYHQCYKISLRQAHHYKVLVAFKKNCLFQLHANLWCIVFVQFNTVIHYIKTIYIYDIYFDREWYGCHLRIYSLFFSKIFRWYNKNWMYLDCIRIVYNLTLLVRYVLQRSIYKYLWSCCFSKRCNKNVSNSKSVQTI